MVQNLAIGLFHLLKGMRSIEWCDGNIATVNLVSYLVRTNNTQGSRLKIGNPKSYNLETLLVRIDAPDRIVTSTLLLS